FFQAEDGIRDFHVTGVQTCALPIWPAGPAGRSPPGAVAAPSIAARPAAGSTGFHRAAGLAGWTPPIPVAARTADPPAGLDPADEIGRASWRERGGVSGVARAWAQRG